MSITRAQFRQLQALEQFTSGKHLLTKDLRLKGRYNTFSPLNLIYFLFGTFSDRKVAISVHKLLSSKNVQEYLAQKPTRAEKIQRSVTLLDMKFSEKGNTILKKVQAAQMQMDPATKEAIQKATNLSGPKGDQLVDCLEAAYPKLKITKQLGKGGYGSVYLFEHKNGKETKSKVLKLSPWQYVEKASEVYRMDENRFGGEWLALGKRDKHVVESFAALAFHKQTKRFVLIGRKKFQKFYQTPSLLKGNSYHLVGTISRHIEGAKELKYTDLFTVDQMRSIARQVVEGVKTLHDQKIMHRDLKPGNILIDTDGNITIIDFGEAKEFKKRGHKRGHSEVGTSHYISSARRMNKSSGYDERVDIYAVGVILHDLVTGKLLGGETKREEYDYHKTKAAEKAGLESHPAVKNLEDRQFADLIGKLGAYEITDRPFADEALRHPYFTSPQS